MWSRCAGIIYSSRRQHKQVNHLFNGKRYTLSPSASPFRRRLNEVDSRSFDYAQGKLSALAKTPVGTLGEITPKQ
ncbi:MAG: hypothetical protein JW947_07730 [Sedimentisphaerales bacterium]|nr:hypothetical protein [Sedimentisphaerales bacterium]